MGVNFLYEISFLWLTYEAKASSQPVHPSKLAELYWLTSTQCVCQPSIKKYFTPSLFTNNHYAISISVITKSPMPPQPSPLKYPLAKTVAPLGFRSIHQVQSDDAMGLSETVVYPHPNNACSIWQKPLVK